MERSKDVFVRLQEEEADEYLQDYIYLQEAMMEMEWEFYEGENKPAGIVYLDDYKHNEDKPKQEEANVLPF